MSTAAAVSAPPKDVNRSTKVAIVPQRLAKSSWASTTLTMRDTLEQRHNDQHQFAADALYPAPVTIR